MGCVFDAPGGNGLMISGYNRATLVANNSFALSGASAIVSAGLGGNREDAGAPDFPEGSVFSGNVFREIGVYVKQSGALYVAVTANFTFSGNVAFNAARAAVNINDGAFGGHLLHRNLLFNTVRETHDHGAINSCACGFSRGRARAPKPSARRASLHAPRAFFTPAPPRQRNMQGTGNHISGGRATLLMCRCP